MWARGKVMVQEKQLQRKLALFSSEQF